MSSIPVFDGWEIAGLVCVFLFYVGAASSLGGAAALHFYGDGCQRTVKRVLLYQLIGGLLGFHAVLVFFLVQVGQINSSGIGGMFDPGMAQLLLDTSLGDLSVFRLSAFVLIIVTSAFMLHRCCRSGVVPAPGFYRRNLLLHGLGFILLLISFQYGGHVSVLTPSVRMALAIHFVMFALWIGALYPLYELTNGSDRPGLQLMLRQFGNHAIVFVLGLLSAGALLLYNLIYSPAELVATAYGRALSAKILLAFCLLCTAIVNRYRLVPQLLDGEGKGLGRFRRSVRLEVAVASLLLLVTAYLSTMAGPMNLGFSTEQGG